VDVPRGERVQLEEGRARVDEAVHALAREELPARAVLLDRLGAAALLDLRGALAELGHERLHAGAVLGEAVRGAVGAGVEDHRAEAYAAGAPAGRLPDAYEALTNRVQKDRTLAHVPPPIGERRTPPLRRAVPFLVTCGAVLVVAPSALAVPIVGTPHNDTIVG